MAVCGGGALDRPPDAPTGGLLAPLPVEPTDVLGLPVMQVEACAFAWLARQTILGKQGTFQTSRAHKAPVFRGHLPRLMPFAGLGLVRQRSWNRNHRWW